MNKSSSIDFEASLVNQVATPDRKPFLIALDELCSGCDRGFIVVRLAMQKAPRHFLPSDRWDTLARWELRNDPGSAPTSGYFAGTKDFDLVRKRTARLLLDIRKLRTTRWINQLIEAGAIRKGDLLHLQTSFDCFDGLLSLKHWARSGQPKDKETEQNELLSEIVSHIHERTREWRDHALAAVHYFLRLPHATEDDMKSWRASRRKKHTRGKRHARG